MLHLNLGHLLAVGMCIGITCALIAGGIVVYMVRRDGRHTRHSDLHVSEILDHPTQPLYNGHQYGDQLNTDAAKVPGDEGAG